ncbi:MAG: hypothetical protein JWR63_1024 [Conexibacter sp.]|nr:hypothetical protein [Conexibacter sp.]
MRKRCLIHERYPVRAGEVEDLEVELPADMTAGALAGRPREAVRMTEDEFVARVAPLLV